MVEKGKSGSVINYDDARIITLDILKSVAFYCDCNGIQYFLAYGTLLGAVRHKGYIPWDNDIDIYVPRPDYEKLRSIVKRKPVHNTIDILDFNENKTFPFLKAVDNRTVLAEKYMVTEELLGVYVDIFPLDGLPDNKNDAFKLLKKSAFLNKLYSLSNYRFNTGSSRTIRILKDLFYPISRLLPKKRICNKLDGLCEVYSYNSSKYVGNIVWGYGTREFLHKEWFVKTCEIEFEDGVFHAPINYDEYLKAIYGDYMTLPSVEDRVIHYFDTKWK